MKVTSLHLNTSDLLGRIFNVGFSVYALAILAQVIQSYNLV